ncbi:cytosolic phospholipase A2 gamma isoform X1 [Ochotona curzoniae]|uniref:cytosolic phospholipase A2 gamma isoform X1 n=1 Tax=Ochotona curzoniae TaxID=130825 RepID=UPI001B349D2B|nr:cytosolic phospholipase A2 gamma isoform X1 [Ochotona curzoniae]
MQGFLFVGDTSLTCVTVLQRRTGCTELKITHTDGRLTDGQQPEGPRYLKWTHTLCQYKLPAAALSPRPAGRHVVCCALLGPDHPHRQASVPELPLPPGPTAPAAEGGQAPGACTQLRRSGKMDPVPPCCHDGSSDVSIITGIQKEEKEAVEKRSQQVLMALKNLDIKANKAPVVTVLCSGGGLRAHIACLGVLSELKEQGLLDAVTYLAGVSGSTWAMASFYDCEGDTKKAEDDLKCRFEQNGWDMIDQSLEKVFQAATGESYSLTDFWAYIVVARQTRELQESPLSSMKQPVDTGALPYPIFAAIDGDLEASWKEKKTQETWFEFTPHHVGYPALGAYIPATHLGSRFENGKLVELKPERDLAFLKGLWGSALASLELIKGYIWGYLCNLKTQLGEKPRLREGERAKYIGVARMMQEGLETCTEESAVQWQEELSAYSEEGATQWQEELSAYSEVNTVVWQEMSMHIEEGSTTWQEELSICRQLSIRDPFNCLINFVYKTGLCLFKWEWGTIHNFLYRYDTIPYKTLCDRQFLHLVDAGFAINSPYPLVLPPARDADLIISFDFSSGDPFETLRATAAYCQHNSIHFPPVDEAKLQEWAQDPHSCYILQGDKGPVVMHIPLFNLDNCGTEMQDCINTYGTIKLSDTYSLELITKLLELSKQNVRLNKDNILKEMRKAASAVSCKASHAEHGRGCQAMHI